MNADLEFDGERYVPGTPGEIAYEHWHRYAFVRRFAKGKRVLDAACGEGYGTALLAPVAASATGVDIDAAVVAHATARYGSNARLQYRAGSVAELPFADASFDLVVSFETIEHLAAADQPRMLAEFGRVLTPRGLLILSSPNKQRYSEANDYENPFHQHELDRDELVRCLDAAFPHRRWFHQQPLFASAIWSEGRIEGTALGEAWCGHADAVDALSIDDGVYYVVLAARTAEALPTRESRISIYVDSDDSELKRVRFQASEVMRLDRQMHERNDLVERKDEHIRHLERLVAERERLIIERDAQLGPMNSMREAAEHATSAARDALSVAERARDEQLALVVQRDRELVAARQTGASAQAEASRLEGVVAAQERMIAHQQSWRWWLHLPWIRLRLGWQRWRGG
jgi:SAM-dependent methyltransferase